MVEIEGFEEDNEDKNSNNDYDESVYSPKSEFKKALLAMEAVRKCIESRGNEMKQGFWNTKIDKMGNPIKTWIEDQRKVYINSVIALESFLSAECLNDEKYQDFIKEIKEEIKNVFDKYNYTIYEMTSDYNWKKTDKKIMPQIDEEVLVVVPGNQKTLTNVKGAWNAKVNAYYDELILLYDNVFKELNKVIFRLNDFAEKFSEY